MIILYIQNLSLPALREEAFMAQAYNLVDIDGTLTDPHGDADVPNPIPEEAAESLRELEEDGDYIVLATGAPRCLAGAVGRAIGLRRAWVAADYGTFIVTPEGEEICTLDVAQIDALTRLRDWLEGLMPALSARGDKREVVGQINLFWPGVEAFSAASEVWDAQLAVHPMIAQLFHGHSPVLRRQKNDSDNSWNLLPASAGKENITKWVHQRDGHVRIAAGDTKSDRPLLAAAEWGVVTRHALHHPADPHLVEVVRRNGRGHVAAPHRPHGWGLADGIREYRNYREMAA